MKIIHIIVSALTLILAIGISSCTKNELHPDDYLTSPLSGEYSKDGMWKLYVSEGGSPLTDYGYVRFDSKDLRKGDFKFVNVIPGVSEKVFTNVPLSATQEGLNFTIECVCADKAMIICGDINLGEMKVDIRY